jgi:PKD repeat protein
LTIGPIANSGAYTYSLICMGPGGTTAVSQTLLVGQVPAPTIQLNLTPSSIQPGNSALITWSTSNATSCAGNGGTGSDGWAAPQPIANLAGFKTGAIAAAGEYSYNLSCTGPGGSAQESRVLSVSMSAPAAPPTASLAAHPTFIPPGQSTVLSWSTTNATACSASGGSGSDGWSGTQALSSGGTTVGPIKTAGSYTFTLTCTGSGGSVSQSVGVVASTNSQPPPVTVNISIAPQTITAGSSAALTWSSSNADSCIASGSWSGPQALLGSAVSTGTLTTPGIYSYTLNCTGSGGSAAGTATASLTVNPAPATITTLTAAPASVPAGQYVVLAWNSTGATSCTASGGTGSDGWGGTVATSSVGTNIGPLNAVGQFTYSLICAGPGGASAPSSANVTVTGSSSAATVLTFRATPSTLQTGQSTTLTWSTSGATSCTASGGTGSDGWHGTQAIVSTGTPIGPLNAAGTFTYTLACTGPGGTGAPVSVTVDVNSAPPPAAVTSFTVSSDALQIGQSITLAWTTTNAISCIASDGTGSDGWGGAVAVSSTGTPIGPINVLGSFNYALTCTGPGGSSAPASVSIVVSAAAPAAAIVSFTAVPSKIQTGQSLTLAWSSDAATSCTAGGGTGSDGWSGPEAAQSAATSIGPINTAGTYTYTLTCNGPGGASAPSSAVVTVTTAPAAATIGFFTATPSTLETGQSTVLAWSSNNATGCTATGGTGSDGWNGAEPGSSSGTTVGPFNASGSYVYTLTCTGAGGPSAPSSVTVNVSPPPAPASIVAFAATPSTVAPGMMTVLTWATSGATSCAASGGTGSDGWGGTVGTSSAATVVGPLTAIGTVDYTLTCTGPGGASSPSTVAVTVMAASPQKPTVSLTINGTDPAQIQPGQSPTLAWTSTNATSCTASGGTGSDGWSGSRPTSSTGVVLGPITTPGVYSYTLTCTGTGGSGSSSVELTVISSSSADCGIGQPSTLLLSPAALASSSVSGVCLVDCGVSNLSNLIDASTTNFATIQVAAGVAATVGLSVADNTASFPAGREAGFLMADGDALLSTSLLGSVSVVTSLNGTVQETATIGSLLQLQALGLLFNPDAAFVEFTTTKPFNAVSLNVGSTVSLLSSFKVYGACVTLQ